MQEGSEWGVPAMIYAQIQRFYGATKIYFHT